MTKYVELLFILGMVFANLLWAGRKLAVSYGRYVRASGLREKALAVSNLPVLKKFSFYLLASLMPITVWAYALYPRS